MELVYLWVEEYKNIKRQGFNFSPRFKCEFKAEHEKYKDENGEKKERLKENCELEIIYKEETKKSFLKNFFGENINVTAIVGENGSGKTRLLEVLTLIFTDGMRTESRFFDYIGIKFCLIYKINDVLYSVTNINKKIEFINNTEFTYKENPNSKLIFFHSDLILLNINNQRIDDVIFKDNEQIFIENSDSSKNREKAIIISNTIYHQEINLLKENYFTPTKIRIKEKHRFREDKELYDKAEWETIRSLINTLNSKENALAYFETLYEILVLKGTTYKKEINWLDSSGIDKRYFEQTYRNTLKYENVTLLERYESLVEDSATKIPFGLEFNTSDKRVVEFLFDLPENIFEVDILDEDKSFRELSYGERQLLSQIHVILHNCKKPTYTKNIIDENGELEQDYQINNVLILLDEFELGLHPEWQKKTILYLKDFLKDLDRKINIIITTHSPFLLSDIPKDNILFLEQYKEDDKEVIEDLQKVGNCKNVSGSLKIKQTFGANIHTLLSHGFFMKNGLMGEFAKSKIEQVYKFIVEDDNNFIKTKEEAQFIIDIIGESIIKNQIQELYNKKFNIKSKDEIIAELKAELKIYRAKND